MAAVAAAAAAGGGGGGDRGRSLVDGTEASAAGDRGVDGRRPRGAPRALSERVGASPDWLG